MILMSMDGVGVAESQTVSIMTYFGARDAFRTVRGIYGIRVRRQQEFGIGMCTYCRLA